MISKSKLLFIFFLFSILLRGPSFFPSVLSHDESTYLVMGRDIMNGKILYHDVIDIKPSGIFIIAGFIAKVTNNSIFAFRLFTAIAISLTAFFISLIVSIFIKNRKVLVASGLIYIFFTSIWGYFGISPNTEQYFNLFTVAGGYVFLYRQKSWNMLLAGFLWGLGFIIKYVMLFDVMAILLFFLIRQQKESGRYITLKIFYHYFLILLTFLVPFLSVMAYFRLIGHYEDFHYITFEAVSKYASERNPLDFLLYLLFFHARFFPFFLFFYYALFSSKEILKDMKLLTLLWAGFAAIAIYLQSNQFGHYMIQLMVPISLFAGTYFHPEIVKPPVLQKFTIGKPARVIFSIFTLAIMVSAVFSYMVPEDTPRKVARYINKNTNSEDIIYTANYKQIIYLLTNKESPTPYIHPTVLFSKRLQKPMGIYENLEIEKILEQKPKMILIYKIFPGEYLKQQVHLKYKKVKTFDSSVYVYERLEDY